MWPNQQRANFDAAQVKDKKIVFIEGADHGYLPSGPKAGKGTQRQQAAAAIVEWLNGKFQQ